MQSQAIAQACPVIGILHLNPGGTDKSRGHLGSELNRKAETVLRLTKDGDRTTVTTSHVRHAPIPANDAPQFAWSDEHGRHVSLVTAGTIKAAADEIELRQMVAAVWQDNRQAVRKYEDIIREIMRYRGKSESDAKRKFGSSQQLNLVQKALGGIGYILTEKGSALP